MNAQVMNRMARYPHDRIAFTKDGCYRDREAFNLYCNNAISLEELCKRLAYNNNLPSVTEEQALNELRLCGYEG